MIRAFALPANGGVVMVVAANGTYNHADLTAAKAATSGHISQNKANFQNGYDAFIVDTEKQAIVSYATIPQPTLDWKDSRL